MLQCVCWVLRNNWLLAQPKRGREKRNMLRIVRAHWLVQAGSSNKIDFVLYVARISFEIVTFGARTFRTGKEMKKLRTSANMFVDRFRTMTTCSLGAPHDD